MAPRQGFMSKTDDQRLVERVQRGDKVAFDLLVLKYQHKVVKLIMRYVRDPTEALDVSQEAFLKAYRALPKFRGDSAFYTWLYRIAVNTAKNHIVAMNRRPIEYDLDLQESDGYELNVRLRNEDSPEKIAQRDELRQAVQSAIESLPDELRAAILFREIDGLSYEEIAHAMDCPVGTVRSRIFRAREAIDKTIQPLIGEPSSA
jgi:RNA polymerase sigma-70 factor (ECF subfamily)